SSCHYCPSHRLHPFLHSFPTRRSSDLARLQLHFLEADRFVRVLHSRRQRSQRNLPVRERGGHRRRCRRGERRLSAWHAAHVLIAKSPLSGAVVCRSFFALRRLFSAGVSLCECFHFGSVEVGNRPKGHASIDP